MGENYKKVSEEVIKQFENVVGKKNIIVDREKLKNYSGDESWLLYEEPDVVLLPEDKKQVSEIMKLANMYKIPVTPRGAGTGVSGGAIPVEKGIVLSLEKLNKILKIEPINRIAVVQPFVINKQLKDEVRKFNLFYPPDPASFENSTIGGNVAENAGGPSAVKYGTTKDYVIGLEVVLPTGEIIKLGGKVHKDVTGYNLSGLFIGSEGTLGIFTEITLKLIPYPAYRLDMLVPFKNIMDAVNLLPHIFKSSLLPVNIEFMEKTGIEAVKKFKEIPPLPEETEAVIIIGFDAEVKESINSIIEEAGEIILQNKGLDVYIADNEQDRERIWEMRRNLHDSLKGISPVIEREDIVVPINKIPQIIDFIYKLKDKYNITIVPFGHLGDGNIHVNILKKTTDEKEWLSKKEIIIEELLKEVVELNGKITGEHGIGILKKPYLTLNISPEELKIYKKLKKIFDPNNILNPGKIFDI